MDAIARLWSEAGDWEDVAGFYRSIEGANGGQLAAFSVMWYASEVSNGGHSLFFSNGTGMIWPEALRGFRLFGAREHADVLSAAIVRFGSRPPALARGTRNDQLDLLPEDVDFGLEDSRFSAVEDRSPIHEVCEAYIRSNSMEFFVR